MASQYQIYALKYGERETKEGQFFFREASQKPLTLHFYVWVILGGPHPIVVDTGCTEPDARLKELRAFVSPADMLARVRRIIEEELTERQREALILLGVKDMPMEDAARKLKTNRNALYKLLHDARIRLKNRLLMEDISPYEVLSLFEQK